MSDAPADWLTKHDYLLPTRGRALDLACGSGRHALWLAARGLAVVALDNNATALAALHSEATRLNLPIMVAERDLEGDEGPLAGEAFDVIVCVHYLHRPLFPAIVDALRPGGVLVYETFTHAQAAIGRPRTPAYLLATGELPGLVHALEVLAAREGCFGGRYLSSVVARKGM